MAEATSQRPQWDTSTTVSPMAAIIFPASPFQPTGWHVRHFNYELYDKDIADSLVQPGEPGYGVAVGDAVSGHYHKVFPPLNNL